jgi:hypothetical protein
MQQSEVSKKMKNEMCADCKIMIEEGWYISPNPRSILGGSEDVTKHFCVKCRFVLEIIDD